MVIGDVFDDGEFWVIVGVVDKRIMVFVVIGVKEFLKVIFVDGNFGRDWNKLFFLVLVFLYGEFFVVKGFCRLVFYFKDYCQGGCLVLDLFSECVYVGFFFFDIDRNVCGVVEYKICEVQFFGEIVDKGMEFDFLDNVFDVDGYFVCYFFGVFFRFNVNGFFRQDRYE